MAPRLVVTPPESYMSLCEPATDQNTKHQTEQTAGTTPETLVHMLFPHAPKRNAVVFDETTRFCGSDDRSKICPKISIFSRKSTAHTMTQPPTGSTTEQDEAFGRMIGQAADVSHVNSNAHTPSKAAKTGWPYRG